MVKNISVLGRLGFVGINLCGQLFFKQNVFEITVLEMRNSFPEQCRVAAVRKTDNFREAVTGDVVLNLAAAQKDDESDKWSIIKKMWTGPKMLQRFLVKRI